MDETHLIWDNDDKTANEQASRKQARENENKNNKQTKNYAHHLYVRRTDETPLKTQQLHTHRVNGNKQWLY